MKLMKAIFIMAITVGLSITLMVNRMGQVEEEKPPFHSDDSSTTFSSKAFDQEPKPMALKKLSRFLAEDKNPRAADHCNKDEEVCYLLGGKNYTCCNNKCFDLTSDNSHCGACKNKCHFTETCCRGECVYLSLDKRHCGRCNNRCKKGDYCVYGMCSYSA